MLSSVGDAEMEQKANRELRACVEMDKNNPIVSIHDQGLVEIAAL
jgi:phosphoribosylformylglycinamidine synthase